MLDKRKKGLQYLTARSFAKFKSRCWRSKFNLRRLLIGSSRRQTMRKASLSIFTECKTRIKKKTCFATFLLSIITSALDHTRLAGLLHICIRGQKHWMSFQASHRINRSALFPSMKREWTTSNIDISPWIRRTTQFQFYSVCGRLAEELLSLDLH